MYQDTIAAIATATGEAGIGMVRLSGPRARAIAERVFTGCPKDHRLVYGRLLDPQAGAVVDEVMAVYLAGPRSYTREDMVEFTCHGGVQPLQRALQVLLAQGARLAEPGEFTLRAFLNGRIDLAQAESVLDVIQALTPRALDLALEGVEGALSRRVKTCRDRLMDLLAYLTALVDFPEDEVGQVDVAGPLAAAAKELDSLLATAGEGMVLRQGVRTAIVGLPNAGKSSLLNRLLGWERAIVTDVPGTTRDTLEETVSVGGMAFVLTDTAGIGATADPVERAGVQRSRRHAASANLVLLVVDASLPVSEDELAVARDLASSRVLVVLNKADLSPAERPEERVAQLAGGCEWPWVAVSALTGEGVDELAAAMTAAVASGQVRAGHEAIVSNPRHAAALERARTHVQSALAGHRSGTPPDLLTIDLTAATVALGEITGETADEELLNLVFSRFCIGK